jgi:enterochelin esterase-like enzyme
LFDPATAFAGVDWRVGVAAKRLIGEGKIPPVVIAGIDNTGESRLREYIPYRSLELRLFGPQGKRYPEFLLREVMPLVEKYYRVAKGPEHTGLGGSSLGGLITLYTQLAAPGVFGQLLIESPSLFVANRKILKVPDFGIGASYLSGDQDAREWEMKRAVNDVRAGQILRTGVGKSTIKSDRKAGICGARARFSEALEFLYSGHG